MKSTKLGTLGLDPGGPRLKSSGAALEVRNDADSAYAVVRGGTPVGANDLTTKGYVAGVVPTAGAAVLDFGPAGESNQRATTTVTGQASILAGSTVRAWIVAEDTATHSAYEHQMVQLFVTCGAIVPGVGFDIVATTTWLLNGTFNVRWEWLP